MNPVSTESNFHNMKPLDFDLDGYQPMSVAHQLRGALLHCIKTKQVLLPEIDGREESKADVIRTLLSGAHPYLVSEEGTGKTRLSRSLTNLLPDIPIIKGCPYNDDPKWDHDRLCPRCRAKKDPVAEFGIDFIQGVKRFSRIQGNEYTNEAKLLGIKDIQSIAHGKSLSDPEAFTGTGVFRANRGILFVDEMPAIRTKIQVLFHPVLEEKMAVLEEYNWQHPLDLIFVATGNPMGFSHVNDIPRPLLDRLELIYMDMPDEDVEKRIILTERFSEKGSRETHIQHETPQYFTPEDIARKVSAPWWIIDIVNKAVRHSRICQYVEKRPRISASIRALDHTYASVEIENKQITNLSHVYYGVRLALRGRVGLRADLIDFEEPRKTFNLISRLSEDFIWNVFENIYNDRSFIGEWDRHKVGTELRGLLTAGIDLTDRKLSDSVLSGYSEVNEIVQRMKRMGKENIDSSTASDADIKIYDSLDEDTMGQLNFSAIETLANICVHAKTLSDSQLNQMFYAREYV